VLTTLGSLVVAEVGVVVLVSVVVPGLLETIGFVTRRERRVRRCCALASTKQRPILKSMTNTNNRCIIKRQSMTNLPAKITKYQSEDAFKASASDNSKNLHAARPLSVPAYFTPFHWR
jgi:hypothetical protein